MATFVKVTAFQHYQSGSSGEMRTEETTQFINLDLVETLWRLEDRTRVFFQGSPDSFTVVKETPEEILQRD